MLNFDQPTPIQVAAIPALLEGRDVVGQAQTGAGKTVALQTYGVMVNIMVVSPF